MWILIAMAATLLVMAQSAEAQAAQRQTEQALIDGFLEKRGVAELSFVAALKPLMRELVRRRWAKLWPQMEDIEQTGVVTVFRMREREPKRVLPMLVELVSTLLVGDAHKRLRELRRRGEVPDVEPTVSTEAAAAAAIDGRRLLALLAKLPDEQASVLLHKVAEVEGEGPPLHEALAVTPRLATKRLQYARGLLFALVHPGTSPAEAALG